MAGKKIMIIEDDQDILEILTHILTEQGYKVFALNNGQAINPIKEYNPDLILCDIWLPNQKGTDLCRTLKADENNRHIPFILISTSMNLPQEAMECGADSYIQKPFNIKEVISIVATYL